jgi:hypothetical protein
MHAVEGTGSHLQHCPLSFVKVLGPVVPASTGPGRLDDAASAVTGIPRGATHRSDAALEASRILAGGRPEHQSAGIIGRTTSRLGRSERCSVQTIVVVHTCMNATDTAELRGASRGYRPPHRHQSEVPSVGPLVAQPARPLTALSPTPT